MTKSIFRALALAESGYPVFPVLPRSKKPATVHGCKDASRDLDAIKQQPWICDSNIGIATDGLCVIDIDNPELFNRLLAELGEEIPTNAMQVRTSKGGHIYFQGVVRNRVGVANCFDTRGNGGYVIAPGSVHPTGAIYELVTPLVHADELPVVPAWICALLEPKQAPANPPIEVGGDKKRYLLAALRGECERVANAPVGSRNHALNTAAFSLGTLVAAGHLSESEVAIILARAALSIGLSQEETTKTITSGLRAGMKLPREVRSHG